MEGYTKLGEELKEEIREMTEECRKQDGTYLEIFLENTFNVYKEMKCYFTERVKGRLAGVLCVYADSQETAEISCWVLPGERRKGIFTRLLEAAKRECEAYGYRKFLFRTEARFPDAEKILKAYGAKEANQEYHMRADQKQAEKAEQERKGTKSSLLVRRAREEEFLALAKILQESFAEGEATALRYVQETFFGEKSELYTAEVKGTPIGCVSVDKSGRDFYVYGLCIAEKERRKGYGREMLGKLVKLLFKAPGKEIFLDVDQENLAALPMYEASGFEQVSKYVYYELPICAAGKQ